MSQHTSSSGLDSQAIPPLSIYDSYLCREPADDVPLLIHNGPDEYTAQMRTLQRSADYYTERDQVRAVERLQWEMVKVHMQHEEWERAARVLRPLWQTLSWRKAGWWKLLDEVDWALRDCASRLRDLETLIAVDWELLSRSLTSRQDWTYDFSKALSPLKPFEKRPRVVLNAENLLSCISATFAFSTSEGNVGEDLHSQVVVSSQAQALSTPLAISEIKVAFGGSLRPVTIQHNHSATAHAQADDETVYIYNVPLHRATTDASALNSRPAISKFGQLANGLVGSADLKLSPGVTKAFSISHVPRDAEDLEVTSLTLCLNEDDFDLELIFTEDEQIHQQDIWVSSSASPAKKMLRSKRSSMIKILPKPPKMRIEIDIEHSTYYTDELVVIDMQVLNEEEEEAEVILEARIVGGNSTLPKLTWNTAQAEKTTLGGTGDETPDQTSNTVISKSIGRLVPSAKQDHAICVEAMSEAVEYDVEIWARYHLLPDPETPVSRYNATRIKVQPALEISHSFTPLIDARPWPNYFDGDDLDKNAEGSTDENVLATGLTQKWCLTSRLYSSAAVPLVIESIQPRVLDIHEAATCKVVSDSQSIPSNTLISSHDLLEREAVLEVQKLDLEDRQSTFLDLHMEVIWHREGSKGSSTVTSLAIPELTIPFGEPRVLATTQNGDMPPGAIHLSYIIENPSTFALSFNTTMDTSDEFAFSGPKNVNITLLPLGRHTVRYNLMPLVKGSWISPQFRVFDTHFEKALKVHATQGVRSDKKGVSIWVDADG